MLTLCKGDPLLDMVRRTFRAQPIRVPEERVRPLVVFAKRGEQFDFVGPLRDLVVPDARAVVNRLRPSSSAMADVTSRRSGEVDTDLGLRILDGFLQGLHIAGTLPVISAQFSRVTRVSFTFHDVVRKWIAPSSIGNALTQGVFALDNSAVAGLQGGGSLQIFIVDSVIASPAFTMAAEHAAAKDFKVAVAEINQLVNASAKVGIRTATGRELTFSGSKELPFAFTCQRASLDGKGGQVQLGAFTGRAAFARPPTHPRPPTPAVLTSEPGLLEWSK